MYRLVLGKNTALACCISAISLLLQVEERQINDALTTYNDNLDALDLKVTWILKMSLISWL